MKKLVVPQHKKLWFTSDLHGYHKNISGPNRSEWPIGYRNFKDEYVMTNHLIDLINLSVKPDDVLIHMGDFTINLQKVAELRQRILCTTVVNIWGNHDRPDKKGDYSGFHMNEDLLRITYGKDTIICCHYPLRSWWGSGKGWYHLFGHVHGNMEGDGKSMDVGVDVAHKLFGFYRPFLWEEVKQILDKKENLYHHDR